MRNSIQFFACTLAILLVLSIFSGCVPAVVNVPGNTPDPTIIDISPDQTPEPDFTPAPTLTLEPIFSPAPTIDPTAYQDKKLVALTFDDGPSRRATGRILDTLEEYGVVATFFVVGKASPSQEDSESLKRDRHALMKRAVEMGCEIGNHTMEHKYLTQLTALEILEQINGVNDIVFEATGTTPTLVRPPYGSKSQLVFDTVQFPLILWSIDTRDWETRNADKTYNAVMNYVRDGDIVLMHDLYESTAEAVERIVPALLEQGFTLVTVSQLFQYRGIEITAGNFYRGANDAA